MANQPTEHLSPSKQAARRVGTDLNAKWRIDRVLGVGGMGAVFAATHRNNGNLAAIKVLHAEFAHTADVRERFMREGRIANLIDHPARVPVVDDGMSDLGEPFLVMELLQGMTLSDLLKRGGGRVPLDKLLGIFETVLDLLAKCHEIDIIHRDIKPANIFLTKQGTVKVIDFGVARMREPESGVDATRAGIALGTASFIAPEQALGIDKLDGRADIFSVGACLYTGITGERLNSAKTEAEEFILAATRAAPSIARKAPDLPPEMVAFVDKALSYERGARFQTAREMRTELLKLSVALTSGQVKAARKGATGVVVRGNDAIDEGPDLSDVDLKLQMDRLTAIFKHLGNALSSVRQYGLGHPQTQRALTLAYQEVASALAASPHSVRWDVMSGAFLFEGEPVWAPDRVPFDRIPHQLYADGIRKVQLKPGVTEGELRDLVSILLRDLSSTFGVEDDSLTALWDRRFEHIAYLAVDSFAEGDNLEPDRLMDWQTIAQQTLELTGIDKDFDEQGLEEQAIEVNTMTRLKAAGEAAAQLALDPATKATMGAQLALPPERWLEAFLDALVPAYVDAKQRNDVALIHKALLDWVQDQLALQTVGAIFEVHERMAQAFALQLPDDLARRYALETAEVMFPIEVLRTLMSDISQERRAGWGEATAAPKELVAGLGRALELLASDAVFALACECLDSARSEFLREVLEPYVIRWTPGKEQQLGLMLARAGPTLGMFLVKTLADLLTAEAKTAMIAAFSNPNVEVRMAALAAMGETVPDRARDEIMALLDAPDISLRIRALELVGSMSVVAAGPSLARRIQSDAFHDLSVEERRKWLETVTVLKSSRGEYLAIELLSKRRLLSGEASEQSRALAAEILGQFESHESTEALEAALKQRWGTSTIVREAATAALAAIAARKATRGKKTDARAAEGKA